MASNTPNLNLLKKDPATDGNDTFNIQTMLNDNWDKIDTAFANVPEQIKELTQAAITYKKIPAGISSINELTEIGIYFTPDLSTLTDTPLNPVEGNWTGAHAIINVYNVMPPYAGASFLRIVELYITYGTTKQYYFRRNTKISISGSNTTITHGSWERILTSTGGTINGDMVINGTTQTKGPLQAYGDGGNALALIGQTHNYISFYPQGVNAGRQGYFGFPSSGSKEFNISAADTLRFSDKSNAITLAEITGMAYQGNVPAPSLELGYNRTNSGPSFVDFHSTPGRDNDGRILVDADRTMFLEAKMISFTDQWRTYTLNGIYDDVQSAKQSGADRKQQLVSAIIANGGSASTSEDMSGLINKLSSIAMTRYKEGTVVRNAPGDNYLVMPGGFSKKIMAHYGQAFSPVPSIGIFSLGSNSSVVIYAVDADGRQVDLITDTVAGRAYELFGIGAEPGYVWINWKESSRNQLTTWRRITASGFRIDGGVRFGVRTTGSVNYSSATSGNFDCWGG